MNKTPPEPRRILDLGTGKHWKRYLGNVEDEIICVDKSFTSINSSKVPEHINLKNEDIFKYLESEGTCYHKIFANIFPSAYKWYAIARGINVQEAYPGNPHIS